MKTTIKYQKLVNRLLKFYKCEIKQFNKILGIK
jgi:hypothetical protein